ncbi:zona pellucida protein C [Astyanax mexicanus]|uniref:zona pellucida protein C n=1 Tax=Astyanax mexicanus TaxID=7994 RepID=UPI0020CB29C0|nr:zona pellucida protein C [Astyanax mexicanus]
MGAVALCVYLILMTLVWSGHSVENEGPGLSPVYSKAVYQDVWPDFSMLTGGVFGKSLLQPVGLHELGSSYPVPFHPWSFMDPGTRFSIKAVNSTLNGQAGTNVYRRGELVYLQVSSSSLPGQELYLQSCYATSTPNHNDKSTLALISNKGCVSSKQSVVKFVSRQSDVVNFVLDTSSLKFSQIYVHCVVALSDHGLTPDTKSCNYVTDKFRWVELGGRTDVCECCATKCRYPSEYPASFGEFKAVVSTGPLSIKEQELEKQPLTGRTPTISNRRPWILSGASPSGALTSSTGKGWIVSGASVSGSPKVNRSPWQTSPVTADLAVGRGLGDALSLLLPGLMMGVQSSPVIEIEIGYPQRKGRADLLSGQSSVPADVFWRKPEAKFEASLQREDPQQVFPAVKPAYQELLGMADGYPLADAPHLPSGGHYAEAPQPPLESLPDKPEEELRGDVFTNFREPQLEKVSSGENSVASMYDVQKSDVPELIEDHDEGDVLVVSHTELLFKKANADVLDKPEFLKKSELTFKGVSDESSSLDYAEEQGTPGLDDREESAKLSAKKELVSSLMALMRKLNKML